jgi:hypothetical protein
VFERFSKIQPTHKFRRNWVPSRIGTAVCGPTAHPIIFPAQP